MKMKKIYIYEMSEEERTELLGILWAVARPEDFAEATIERIRKEMPGKARRIHDLMVDEEGN